MKRQSEFVLYLGEVFRTFGEIHSRPMFGGYGIYHRGLMIGLVADDALFLKADAISGPIFIEGGSAPFVYHKKGVPMTLSYFSAPEVIFDDPDAARLWANLAFEGAVRAKSRTSKRAG